MEFCQSCCMPLTDTSQRGTEADGARSAHYCSYCYQNGAFTSDCTMEEMIDLCVGPMVEHNPGMDEAQARARMLESFPKLRRWAR